MQKRTVLFVILDQFADFEYPFLATALQDRIQDKTAPFEVKTISVSKDPVKSIGGFTVVPDESVEEYQDDYAALILIGGKTWRTKEAQKMIPILKQAVDEGKVVGAICDATVFLGMNGLLNEKKHTSNTLESLMDGAKENYLGKNHYIHEQAVRDGTLITANGTGYLEFTKEVLKALNAYPPDYIENNYQFFKKGYLEAIKSMKSQ